MSIRVYQSVKSDFLDDVESGTISAIVQERIGRRVSDSERQAWDNSLRQMYIVMQDGDIPADAGIGIEMPVTQTAKRIDFLVSGYDADARDQAVIIELKQWSKVERTPMAGLVRTFVGGGHRHVPHPSYQAWSYASLLQDFNEAVYTRPVALHPCAYLHNHPDDGVLTHAFYTDCTTLAPVFFQQDVKRLRAFIRRVVQRGDRGEVLYHIGAGGVRPSKMLIDAVGAMLSGNRAFVMVDEQKTAFETIRHVATAPGTRKQVVIVQGGPGTGKSVIAIHLMGRLLAEGQVAQYVSRNAAPRAVIKKQLAGKRGAARLHHLFKGSGGFVDAEPGSYGTLLVDEAHRLNEKSGLYGNLGDNQVRELIAAARTSVFFVDEDQRVTLKDIGTVSEIRRWAEAAGAELHELELASQFRCNGSDGYLAFVTHKMGIRETANPTLEGIDYDFQVFDSPGEVFDRIVEKNKGRNRSRMVAGYCWDWASKKDPRKFDIVIPEHDFRKRWNLTDDGAGWMAAEHSITEIGCIHTIQGLELDHVGVLIGPDLGFEDGQVVCRPEKRSRMDQSIKGWKTRMKSDPVGTRAALDRIIRNTYRTLLTRGMKGCYVWCADPALAAWLRDEG